MIERLIRIAGAAAVLGVACWFFARNWQEIEWAVRTAFGHDR